ncbi:transposase [bacterium]|nr:transposase [bacterium]
MSLKRKKYSKQFKLETVAAYENGDQSIAKLERDMGLAKGLLRRWQRELLGANNPDEVFPGNGNLPESEARIRQLERENAQLRMEKAILKKVLGMYSRDAP